ncbi:MAG TPA: hypothetical protein VKU91_05230 [Acidimicrobiales bacterium]|nr:hypothetical protein [Acidimicrobiales bacterium]
MVVGAVRFPVPVPGSGLPLPGVPGLAAPGLALGGLSRGAVSAILDGVVAYLVSGAQGLLQAVTGVVGEATPQVGAGWLTAHLAAMGWLVSVLMMPLLAAATIGAVLRQDMGRLGRTWGVALPLALLGGALVVPLTLEGERVTDAMSSVVAGHLGVDIPDALDSVGRVLAGIGTTGAGGLLAGVLALLVVMGSFFLWLELVLRSAAIYLAVFFMPLALAGLVWPASAHWARRCIHLLVALLLSKFVIVSALTVGVGALAASRGRLDQGLMGGAVLLLAAFAPFLLLRMAPVIEAAAIAHLEGASHRPLRAAARTAAAATNVGGHPLASAMASLRSGADAPVPEPVQAQLQDLARLGGDVGAVPPAPGFGESPSAPPPPACPAGGVGRRAGPVLPPPSPSAGARGRTPGSAPAAPGGMSEGVGDDG